MEKTPTFQTCPHCNGTGIDKNQMYSTTAFPTCGVCQGQKIISTVTGMPPILLVPVAPPHEDKGAEQILNELFYKPETKDWYKPALKAMQEYASNERNRAIDQCIKIIDDNYGNGLGPALLCNSIKSELSKLKT